MPVDYYNLLKRSTINKWKTENKPKEISSNPPAAQKAKKCDAHKIGYGMRHSLGGAW